MAIRHLHWSEIHSASRDFDPGPARAIAERLVLAAAGGDPTRNEPAPNVDREKLEESIDRALVTEYGTWATGFRWAATEPGGGGPVRAWCCGSHSLFREDDPGALASVDRVVAALSDFHEFLGELANTFADLHKETEGLSMEESIERAAARLLTIILQRTRHEDAWYNTFAVVMGWWLESAGHDAAMFAAAVRAVVEGHFQSWCEPTPEAARSACAALGLEIAIAQQQGPGPPCDALSDWRAARDQAFTRYSPDPPLDPVLGDGHQRFIEGPERARDPERAARMAAALEVCRASARRGEDLTFERLAAWQAVVLGAPADFRTGDAYAKGGRERYPLASDTRRTFDAALAEANGAEGPTAVRAARAYLDVCFFHPFADGNARAARLALDHVITRAGLAFHAIEPVIVVSRSASDRYSPFGLALLIEHLTGPPAQRETTGHPRRESLAPRDRA